MQKSAQECENKGNRSEHVGTWRVRRPNAGNARRSAGLLWINHDPWYHELYYMSNIIIVLECAIWTIYSKDFVRRRKQRSRAHCVSMQWFRGYGMRGAGCQEEIKVKSPTRRNGVWGTRDLLPLGIARWRFKAATRAPTLTGLLALLGCHL